MADDRRLIEDYLPIQAISAEASREKSVRQGHISTLHLWWARRPLVACRAAVYGALVPADQFAPGNGTNGKKQSLGRANAAKFVKRLCRYPSDSKPDEKADIERAVKEAQRHIYEAHAQRLTQETQKKVTAEDIEAGRAPRPKVLDMFAGGGAIPLEALRMGCETHALDLNPVAHLVELCTLVYPQKYGRPDPSMPGMSGAKNEKGESTWGGLAEEVRWWGTWILDQALNELAELYPVLPDPDAPRRALKDRVHLPGMDPGGTLTIPEGFLTPVAYLWTRAVPCKDRACGATVPLVRQTWLCKKKGRYVGIQVIAPRGKKRVRFDVVTAETEEELGFDPADFSQGGNATCPFCGAVADIDYVKATANQAGLTHQLMAVVVESPKKRGKRYLSAADIDEGLLADQAKALLKRLSGKAGFAVPDEPLEANPRSFDVQHFGFKNWRDVFTERQLASMMVFAGAVKKSTESIEQAMGDADRTQAIVLTLGVALGRLAGVHPVMSQPDAGRGLVGTLFG